MSQFEDSCQLEISRVYPEDEGEYSCVATNGGGTASCTATLTLDGESALLTLHKRTNGHICPADGRQRAHLRFSQRPFGCSSESFLFWGRVELDSPVNEAASFQDKRSARRRLSGPSESAWPV